MSLPEPEPDHVAYVYDKNLMLGTAADRFSPNGSTTWEQLVTMLYRYCQSKDRDASKCTPLTSFSDAGTASGYAAQAMSRAVSEEIITGMGDNTIAPYSSATRAQMAAVLY